MFPPPQPKTVSTKEEWTRWNDYGLPFLQGDLKKLPLRRSNKSRKPIPQNPDGWTNIGRVFVQEGDIAGREKSLEKSPGDRSAPCKDEFLYARALKEDLATNDSAMVHLRTVLEHPARPWRERAWSAFISSEAARMTPSRNLNKRFPSIPRICRRITT
jgi:hypothetical protein